MNVKIYIFHEEDEEKGGLVVCITEILFLMEKSRTRFIFTLNTKGYLMSRLSPVLSYSSFSYLKTCYLCEALNISCYVNKTVKILLISFPFQDLFFSTLFFVSE